MSDDLSRIMQSATENLHPDIGKLTAGGIERGVRMRRMRRVSQIAGGAVGVTAVFAVVAIVGTPGHSDSGSSVSAAAGTDTGTTPGAVATSSPIAVPSSTAAAPSTSSPGDKPAAPPVSGEAMVKWLEQATKKYGFSDYSVLYKGGTNDNNGVGGPYATLKLAYSGGVGSMSLTVHRGNWANQQLNGTAPDITAKTLDDGSHMMIFDGLEWPAGNGDPKAKRVSVSWYRTDGVQIDVEVLNEGFEKGATTGTVPPLTADQAVQLVQSPVWDPAIASTLTLPAVPTVKLSPPPSWVDPKKVVQTSPAGKPAH